MPPQIEQDIAPDRRRPFLEARAEALRQQYVTEQANVELAEDNHQQRLTEIADNARLAADRAKADHAQESAERDASLARLSDAYDRVVARLAEVPAAEDAPPSA